MKRLWWNLIILIIWLGVPIMLFSFSIITWDGIIEKLWTKPLADIKSIGSFFYTEEEGCIGLLLFILPITGVLLGGLLWLFNKKKNNDTLFEISRALLILGGLILIANVAGMILLHIIWPILRILLLLIIPLFYFGTPFTSFKAFKKNKKL